MAHKIICSYRGQPLKPTVGLPIGVRMFPPDEKYPYKRLEISSKKPLSTSQQARLFSILSEWFLELKNEENCE